MRTETSQAGQVHLIFGLVLVAVDLIIKQILMVSQMVVWNGGGVLGLGPGQAWLGLGIVTIGVTFWWWRKSGDPMTRWGMTLIMAGGAGNLIDRLFYGAVRDYIGYPWIKVTGNLADIYLTLGVILILGRQWQLSKYHGN